MARRASTVGRSRSSSRLEDASYRRLIENLGGEYFFYRHGCDGIFTYVSPSVGEVLGYSVEEFLTYYADFFTDDPVNVQAVRHTELSLQGIKQPPYPIAVRHKDGSTRHLEVLEVPVFGGDGRVEAIEGIAHDVTGPLGAEARQRQLLLDLETANRRLADADREKTHMLTLVAHNLRSPLTSIRGWAEAIRTLYLGGGAELSAERLGHMSSGLERIVQRADEMTHLLERLLHVSALEDGALSLTLEPQDAAAVAGSVLEDYRRAAAAKDLDMTLKVDGPMPVVRADRQALREVLDNLLSNAVKYSPRAGRIRVDVARSGGVRITVRDEGPGIDAAELPRLFQKFARLAPRPTAGEGSVGLGLSIVKRLVELMGGTVAYEGGPGKGSAFAVELPRADASSRP